MRLLWLVFALLTSAAPAVPGQSSRIFFFRWALEDRDYYDALLADPRAANIHVLFPALSDSYPFAVKQGKHLAWDISVGKEIPLFGLETGISKDQPLAPGKFGFGVWFPISFHMIEDMGKDPSNPILNTDYRFSGMVKAKLGLPAKMRGMRDSHAALRFQFGHESTHLGDEFTLGAQRVHTNTFRRVNVSYEYWELGGSFEPNFGADSLHHLKLRFHYIRLLDTKKGWYSPELLYPFGWRGDCRLEAQLRAFLGNRVLRRAERKRLRLLHLPRPSRPNRVQLRQESPK